jgi:hypothetical protein
MVAGYTHAADLCLIFLAEKFNLLLFVDRAFHFVCGRHRLFLRRGLRGLGY